jgi:prepilin-type N-terminal cleavage/methylation domain-containing protein
MFFKNIYFCKNLAIIERKVLLYKYSLINWSKMLNKMIKKVRVVKSGFSLAEILISIGIIGVVATYTIPTLMDAVKDTKNYAGLRKAQQTLQEALAQTATSNGTPSSVKDLFSANDYTTFGEAFVKKLIVGKNCRNSTDEDCFPDANTNWDGTGSVTTPSKCSMRYKFVTNDGMAISIFPYSSGTYSPNCNNNRSINVTNSPVKNVCAEVLVDTNGDQQPNYFGIDVFVFYITSNKNPIIYPVGSFTNTDENNTGDSSTGGNYYWKRSGTCSASDRQGLTCAGKFIDLGEADYSDH